MTYRASIGLSAILLVASCDDAADSGSHEDHQTQREREDASTPIEMADACVDCRDAGRDAFVVGSPCANDADCGPGRCMSSENVTSTSYPGGYCTASCSEAADCGERGVCSAWFRGRAGTCYLRCETDEDCEREGYRCRMSATSGVGACLPGPRPLPDGTLGSACESDEDCGGNAMSCRTSIGGSEAPGGYCMQACAVNADCGDPGLCISGVNGSNLAIGACYRPCTPPGDCREGYECRSISGGSEDDRGVCVPARSPEDP